MYMIRCMILFFSVLCLPACGRAMDYLAFKSLDAKTRQTLEERYVRQTKDGLWTVSVSVYIIKTNISRAFSLDMAFFMDNFYRKFNQVFIGGVRINRKPRVYVFKDKDQYRSFLSKKNINAGWSHGMYIPAWQFLVTFMSDRDRLERILFHEGTHQLMHAYIGTRIPVWLNEGMATNFETWNIYR